MDSPFRTGSRSAVPPAPLPVTAGELASIDTASRTRDTRPGILFCGGFHSSMQGTKAVHCERLAVARELGYRRFDYRGHGASAGDAAALGIDHWLEDTLAMLRDSDGPQLVIGSSMGAWLAVLAAHRAPSTVAGVLTLAAAPDFTERLMRPAMSAAVHAALDEGISVVRISRYDAVPWPVPAVLLESGRSLQVLDAPRPLGCPLTMLHGTADSDVPHALSMELLAAVGATGDTLTLLHGADHRLSDADSLQAIERALDALLARIAAPLSR